MNIFTLPENFHIPDDRMDTCNLLDVSPVQEADDLEILCFLSYVSILETPVGRSDSHGDSANFWSHNNLDECLREMVPYVPWDMLPLLGHPFLQMEPCHLQLFLGHLC